MTKHELEVLRRGLERFRHINERCGRPLPWKTVIALLLDCPSTTHEHPETGDENEFREEALRRFAKGKSTLLPERLADVKRFLIAQGVITEQDLRSQAAPDQGIAVDSLLAQLSLVPRGNGVPRERLILLRASQRNGTRPVSYEVLFVAEESRLAGLDKG